MSEYKQARSDFEYLETIAELEDQVELDAERETLMQNPTKKRAAFMYKMAIVAWFNEQRSVEKTNKRVMRIAERYL